MSLSHSVQIEHKQQDELFNPIYQFLDNIGNIQQQYDSFEQAEKAIKKLVGKIENSMVQETLSQYDINVPIIEHDGKIYHQVLRKDKTYMSSAGKVTVERSLYRADGQCICPLELQAGIIEDFWTPSAARLGCYVTAHLSPYQGEQLFQEFGSLKPSKSSLTRLSTRIGKKWDEELHQLEQALCHDIVIPEEAVTVSASLDGIMIPLNKKLENGYQAPELGDNPSDKEKTDYEEKKEKAFYREASCAAINFYDEDGERLNTLRFGRMPEGGKKTLKSLIHKAINNIVSEYPEINLIKIADGAIDNWRFLSDSLFPGQGIELLDYFHASDHLNDAFEAAYGKETTTAISQYNKYKILLKIEVGGIEKVINTLRYLSKNDPDNNKLTTELNYFRNNRHRMGYAEAIEANFPIGSGVTEATCKTLVTQRMKCAGMRWDINGGQGVLTARSLIQSKRFDQGWEILSGNYIKEVSLPENVI
ncbi:MAG: hypothetical protein KZQ74_16905, partial [gamma proteobacterium symbiont of Bathyaustriella thionipta]|nr:hypothetical protein [gamma proteobacterium symbiont of Bathyaustriella thionipta]